jgi:hypothetical protein
MTFNFFVIWNEYRPATAALTIMSEKHIPYTWRNVFAGQFGTIPAKTTCANPPSQQFLTRQFRFALITGSLHLKPFTKILLARQFFLFCRDQNIS